ncbi:hypothetical protein AMECASPLE_039208 [Ameca splendens]|uniref:Uncharacterized protein n=1 Tax=Ameca splendens TaxID=208324 RepID=A0ABV0Z782_9TELE
MENASFTALKANWDLMDFFEGVFLAKDAEVTSFVDYIHGATQHNPGKGRCGAGEWVAARESSTKSSSKVDEEGVMVAVCCHGILLKGLNMFHGEIFPYPLYLQKQLASQNVQFFCSDVHIPGCELQWGGQNQEGAGTTIEEEVEQVNSFLSRAAICSKYMSKAVCTDILAIQASGWNKWKAENLDRTLAKRYIKIKTRLIFSSSGCLKLEWTAGTTSQNDLEKTIKGLYLSIKQRKYELYCQFGEKGGVKNDMGRGQAFRAKTK